MPTTPPPQRGNNPTTATTPIPRADTRLRLPDQTVAWLAEHPHARRVVASLWDKLTELEQAGHHPDTIAALRNVLTHHQPTSAGRCRACRRLNWRHLWRRRVFPCLVWHQIRGELLGVFASADRRRQSAIVAGHSTASPSR